MTPATEQKPLYQPLCTHCNRPAAVTYGAIKLCARHFGIDIASRGLAANGTVWDRDSGVFRLPTAEEAARIDAMISAIVKPLCPVADRTEQPHSAARPGAHSPAPGSGGFGSTLHASERERFDRATGGGHA